MKIYELKLAIEAVPTSMNKKLNQHYFKRHAENKKWDRTIELLTAKHRPQKPLSKAMVTFTRHYYRTLDFDGLVGSLKPVMDALVSCGIIADDSWDVVGSWHVMQIFRPKKDGPLLEIEVKSLDD